MFPIWVTFDVPRCGRRSQESVPYNSDGGSDRCNGIEAFLGMFDELAIFLPHLSQDCEILRQLHRKDIEWSWLPHDQKAFEKIKMKLTEAPVLSYYDPNRELTIQCDASQHGLGAALMQGGTPYRICIACSFGSWIKIRTKRKRTSGYSFRLREV